MQAGCLIGEGSITEEMDALHIVIDACCLGRKKTGNESYVGGLLRGLESLPVRLVDIPSNSQARIYSLPMGGEARFTIVTTSAYAGERPKCFHWVNIPTGTFVTRNFVTIPRLVKWLRADAGPIFCPRIQTSFDCFRILKKRDQAVLEDSVRAYHGYLQCDRRGVFTFVP